MLAHLTHITSQVQHKSQTPRACARVFFTERAASLQTQALQTMSTYGAEVAELQAVDHRQVVAVMCGCAQALAAVLLERRLEHPVQLGPRDLFCQCTTQNVDAKGLNLVAEACAVKTGSFSQGLQRPARYTISNNHTHISVCTAAATCLHTHTSLTTIVYVPQQWSRHACFAPATGPCSSCERCS